MRRVILVALALGLALTAAGKSAAQGKRAPDRCFMNTDLGPDLKLPTCPTRRIR